MNGTKLVRRVRLAPAFLELPRQIERFARVLPGILAVSCQMTGLAKPCDHAGLIAHAPVRMLSLIASASRAPLHQAPQKHSPG